MGSIEDKVVGQYMQPFIDHGFQNDDPWQRNHFAPPQNMTLVPRSYPLTDIRPLLSQPDYSPTNLLQSHGFGVVKHHSASLDRLEREETVDQAFAGEYLAEITELVRTTTGAKRVFVTATGFRQGKRAPSQFALPTGLGSMADAKDVQRHAGSQQQQQQQHAEAPKHKLSGQAKFALAAPVRTPHMDYTPLGARQTIRSQSREIYDAAAESGVLAAEDAICAPYAVGAATYDSIPIIAERYNPRDGELGPRYAAYSIWRPLKTVERDPLTLSPRRHERRTEAGEKVYWPYENRVPGPAELNGDFLKQYAMQGVRSKEPGNGAGGAGEPAEWCYISAHEPHEVLFIKLFDSAALGADSKHASAPWHASPEIGGVAGDEPRESIDVRVLVFW